MLLWMWTCTYLFKSLLSIRINTYPEVGRLGCSYSHSLILLGTAVLGIDVRGPPPLLPSGTLFLLNVGATQPGPRGSRLPSPPPQDPGRAT